MNGHIFIRKGFASTPYIEHPNKDSDKQRVTYRFKNFCIKKRFDGVGSFCILQYREHHRAYLHTSKALQVHTDFLQDGHLPIRITNHGLPIYYYSSQNKKESYSLPLVFSDLKQQPPLRQTRVSHQEVTIEFQTTPNIPETQ